MWIRLDLCKIRHTMKERGVRQLDIAKKSGHEPGSGQLCIERSKNW